ELFAMREDDLRAQEARQTTARAELETLTEALLASTGLGGRSRRAAGTEERARQNVRKRLKDAFRRIGAVDPELGRYLERSVRTGRFCRYEP
ncbi:MAG: transcriptional regulator, partial [Myxococcota bacterium]